MTQRSAAQRNAAQRSASRRVATRERDNGGLNVRIYGRAERAARREAQHARRVQQNALIHARAVACAEFERLTDSRDTHVSDEITCSYVQPPDITANTNKTA